MVHSTNHASVLLLPAWCLCTNPFSPTSLYTSPCSGYKESSYQQMDGGTWGPLDKGAARPRSSVFLLFDSLCLSFFPSVSALWFVSFFFCPSLCYHQLQLCQPRLLCSSSCLIFLFVLTGRLWKKQLCSDIQFSFK